MKYTVENLRDRCFIDKNNCWIWGKSPLFYDDSTRSAAKIIFELAYDLRLDTGPVRDMVRHECNVGDCINPAHLSVLTFIATKQGLIRAYLRGYKEYAIDMGDCPNGHPLGDATGSWRSLKTRQGKHRTAANPIYQRSIYCKECKLEHSRNSRKKTTTSPKKVVDWREKARQYLDSV